MLHNLWQLADAKHLARRLFAGLGVLHTNFTLQGTLGSVQDDPQMTNKAVTAVLRFIDEERGFVRAVKRRIGQEGFSAV